MKMVSEPTERNSTVNDSAKRGNDRASTYLSLLLGGVALLFYLVAWFRFWR